MIHYDVAFYLFSVLDTLFLGISASNWGTIITGIKIAFQKKKEKEKKSELN